MANPQFVGEQDGIPERELKARLIARLGRRAEVRAAYLARVAYPGQSGVGVALCLRAHPGLEKQLVADLGEVFSGMFSHREHLDILFLNEGMEEELRILCRPFFSL